MNYYRALTIAGSDNSGGAGIQADLKTFSALGCYGMSVITALTAQNTQGVKGIQEIDPQFIEKQMKSLSIQFIKYLNLRMGMGVTRLRELMEE